MTITREQVERAIVAARVWDDGPLPTPTPERPAPRFKEGAMSALGLTTRYSLERRTCGCTMHVSATGRFVLAADYDALITRLRAAEARTAWQPIETAPMGERALALMDGLTIIAARGMLGWYDDDDRRVSVTAWAPLPAAPEAPHG